VSDSYSKRQKTIQVVFLIASLVLLVQALQLQVLDDDFRSKANTTAIDKYTLYPARGLIYDRNGELMVYNDPMYDLLVTFNQLDPAMDTTKFCSLLGITEEQFKKALDKNWSSDRFSKSVPFVFMGKISARDFATFQESLYEFPGFYVQLRHARGYAHPNGAHVLGHIREVNQQEIDGSQGRYVAGDYIGASGIESAYEQDLKGDKGARYVLKDNLGREVDAYKDGDQDTSAVSGLDLISSIDLELQAYGEALMKNKVGGIVALEPNSGEILAMISAPSYDPSQLTISNNNRGKAYIELNTDSLKPFLNRAVMAQYPPGSLFKTVVALVGLEEEVWPEDRTVVCSGGFRLGGRVLTGCHGHPTCTDVSSAIQHSCNAYFVSMFLEIMDMEGAYNPEKGLTIFNSYLDRMGFGRELGIDFPSEQTGNYPTADYYTNKLYKDEQSWKSVWIRSLGIGQGELLMTNIQMVNLAAIIANRGYYKVPHLIKGFKDGDQEIPEQYLEKHEVGIDSRHFEPVIAGMERAVTSGTARMAHIPDIPVCGKTGTAENPHGKDHSIFFCFAPKDDPQIAIAVYVENAGFGGTYAAPIASLLIEKYMKGEISKQRKWIEQRMLEANLVEGP